MIIINGFEIEQDASSYNLWRVRPQGTSSDVKATWHTDFNDAVKVAETSGMDEDVNGELDLGLNL
jgi:hypothetical protein